MSAFSPMMMMIAHINIKSSLVLLIEGICAQIYFRFEISMVLRSQLLLFFFEGWKLVNKTALVHDLIQPPSIYIHMCTLCTYTNTYMPSFSPSGFFRPSKCLVPTPGLTSEYPTWSVCACVRIHTHTPTYTLTPVKKQTKYRQYFYLPHLQNNELLQQQVPCID